MDVKSVGERLHNRRKELGLTLEQLADKVKLNKSTIMRYESGAIKHLKYPVIVALANALNMNPETLTPCNAESNNDLKIILFEKTKQYWDLFKSSQEEKEQQEYFNNFKLLYSVLCCAGIEIEYNKWASNQEDV